MCGKRDYFFWIIVLNASFPRWRFDLLLFKDQRHTVNMVQWKYKNVDMRTLLFSHMLLTLCRTLGTEHLFLILWNGNRTTCLASLILVQLLWGLYDINYVKIFFEIQIIIQNLGSNLSFWMVWFLCVPHSLPNFHSSDFVFSFPAVFDSVSVIIPFLFPPFTDSLLPPLLIR